MGTLDFGGIERLMLDTLLTSWMIGAAGATKDVRARVDLFAETWEPVPPEEAIAFIQKRVPLPMKKLESILQAMQLKSVELTRGLVDTIAAKIDEKLKEAVRSGKSMRDFLANIDAVAGEAGLTKANPFYWETVFRNNVQTAYQAGRRQIFENPDVKAEFGYYQYLTVGDLAVRPEHAALHGTVWKDGDPAVERFWPPNGHNCRCTIVPLSGEDVAAEGLKVTKGAPKMKRGYERLGIVPPKAASTTKAKPDPGWAGVPKAKPSPPKRAPRKPAPKSALSAIPILGEVRAFADSIERAEWHDRHSRVVKYTEAEDAAKSRYTGVGYHDMNAHLRFGREVVHESTPGHIERLTRAIEKSPVPENVRTYRGIDGRLFRNLPEGAIFEDKGFVSVSLNADTAHEFSRVFGDEGAVIEITVPKGTNALAGHSREDELILQRGSRFLVESITKDAEGRVVRMVWRLVR